MRRLLTYSILAVAASLLLRTEARAQAADYTQYYLNLAGINPGFTGIEDFTDTKFGFRQGWNDFSVKNNSFYLSTYAVLNSQLRSALKGNMLRISSPEVLRSIQEDKKILRKHGVGGMLYSRNLGPYKLFSFNANYSYHIPLTSRLYLSFGTRVGYNSQRINFANYTVRDPIKDEFYQQLMASQQGNIGTAVIDFGTTLYSDRFYLGLSSIDMITTKVSGSVLDLEQAPRYALQFGVTGWNIRPNINLSPGVRLLYEDSQDLLWTLNARLRFYDAFYIGGGFTGPTSRMSFLLGYTAGRYSINYSYDQYLSELNNFNVSMHEFVLGMSLFNKLKARSKIW
ncbi:MAG TPA: PorP/SprF family type IX secretion system membrane protein [Cyclobacteriaceae bacterium]|nr:PorP/SprF family type IX secretion system membrane protein [Cyclobacteriaceae bacterium]